MCGEIKVYHQIKWASNVMNRAEGGLKTTIKTHTHALVYVNMFCEQG